ncbi:MAG: outer membrane beta-barrel protein [Bacteroidota bacterium]
MQRVLLTILVSVVILSVSQAQSFSIRGKIVDGNTRSALEGTTVYAETIKDSTIITYSVSNAKGFFIIEGKTRLKEFNLFFSFTGYETVKMKLSPKVNLDLGEIKLNEQVQQLEDVYVTGDRIPIKIKNDTLEFNANSFKTRPDATVEDVLKRLPGVEIDSDGRITFNGKEVDKVLVNGQVLFSNDPKVVTKSFPKEVIDKIQILDTKTEVQEFTGEEGDGDTKTINLTIKEDKNKGYLGRVSAGYGTDERYQSNGLLNYFRDQERVSIIAGSNNINNAGFSFDEIYDMVGRNSRGGITINSQGGFSIGGLSFGFGQGIVTSSNIGASYANQKKDAYKIDANYFMALSDSFNDEKTLRENILNTGSFFTETESSFNGATNSNQGGANLEFDIDKTLRISVRPQLGITHTDSETGRSTTSTNELEEIINTNRVLTKNNRMNRSFTNNVNILKKLDTIGSLLTLSFSNENSKETSNADFNSETNVFGDNPMTESLDQQTAVDNSLDSYQIEGKYRLSFSKIFSMEFGYSYNNSKRENTRNVVDFDETTGSYSDFNQALSSDFKFSNIQNTPSLSFMTRTDKLNINLTARYTNTNLANSDFLQNSSFSKSYNNLLVNSWFGYTLGNNKRFGISLSTGLSVPQINELQPVPNVSNPLNITIGNPDLRPSINRRIYLNYNNYNWREKTGFFVYMGLSYINDRVSPTTITDENFIRTTRYVNVNGNYNHYGGIGYSKELKKDSTLTVRFNFKPSFNVQKNVGFNNGDRLETKRFTITPRISALFNYKELVTIEPEYFISLNSTKYNLDNLSDISFTSHNLTLKTTSYWPKNLILGNDIGYNYNGNVSGDFDRDAIFWNMSIGLQMMKKKATLKVLGYDILNQNINTRRTTGEDFIQDFQGTVLQRYFMTSFTYKFDQFGGKKTKPSRFGF